LQIGAEDIWVNGFSYLSNFMIRIFLMYYYFFVVTIGLSINTFFMQRWMVLVLIYAKSCLIQIAKEIKCEINSKPIYVVSCYLGANPIGFLILREINKYHDCF
jgi:hypothetical protein